MLKPKGAGATGTKGRLGIVSVSTSPFPLPHFLSLHNVHPNQLVCVRASAHAHPWSNLRLSFLAWVWATCLLNSNTNQRCYLAPGASAAQPLPLSLSLSLSLSLLLALCVSLSLLCVLPLSHSICTHTWAVTKLEPCQL